jgi:hypothetical protein
VRKYLVDVSKSLVVAFLSAVGAAVVHQFVPPNRVLASLSLRELLTYALWLCTLAAVVVSYLELRKLKRNLVLRVDERCSELLGICNNLRTTHPNYGGPLDASTYLPTGSDHEGARASIYRFNGLLAFLIDDLVLIKTATKMSLKVNPGGTATDISEALRDVHHGLRAWLF